MTPKREKHRRRSMICKQCQDEGCKSRVFPGTSTSTLMLCRPFYDEDGKRHHHDINVITTNYRCSNGHTWTNHHSGQCWCGWNAPGGRG